jgi:hypothetical protein
LPRNDDSLTVSPASLSSSKSGAKSPSATTKRTSSLGRAIGVVRVSRVGDRDGERFVSPAEQVERIRSACDRDGLELVETIEELDVSGGALLAKRPGLRRAVEPVEAHEADVVVAYFDRLVRSLPVQREVVERVEVAAGSSPSTWGRFGPTPPPAGSPRRCSGCAGVVKPVYTAGGSVMPDNDARSPFPPLAPTGGLLTQVISLDAGARLVPGHTAAGTVSSNYVPFLGSGSLSSVRARLSR